jgi:hypothetical protein
MDDQLLAPLSKIEEAYCFKLQCLLALDGLFMPQQARAL